MFFFFCSWIFSRRRTGSHQRNVSVMVTSRAWLGLSFWHNCFEIGHWLPLLTRFLPDLASWAPTWATTPGWLTPGPPPTWSTAARTPSTAAPPSTTQQRDTTTVSPQCWANYCSVFTLWGVGFLECSFKILGSRTCSVVSSNCCISISTFTLKVWPTDTHLTLSKRRVFEYFFLKHFKNVCLYKFIPMRSLVMRISSRLYTAKPG